MSVWYVDTSALAKLARPEAETPALRRWLDAKRWVISDLHRTELRHAANRAGGAAPARAERLLSASDVVRITVEVFDEAGWTEPSSLRSLDALHLCAARCLGPDVAGVVTYDERLSNAAIVAGIATASPGA